MICLKLTQTKRAKLKKKSIRSTKKIKTQLIKPFEFSNAEQEMLRLNQVVKEKGKNGKNGEKRKNKKLSKNALCKNKIQNNEYDYCEFNGWFSLHHPHIHRHVI